MWAEAVLPVDLGNGTILDWVTCITEAENQAGAKVSKVPPTHGLRYVIILTKHTSRFLVRILG